MTLIPLHPDDPRRLGDFALVGRLGAGGMGAVYLARATDGRRVAVKVVRREWSADPEFLARFRSEVRRARQVPPFCTAAVLHADLEHVPPFVVVEYVDGPSLAEVVRDRGPLEAGELYSLAVGVATALAAIHGAGVVHRDLKPANVLLGVGLPKVIDFGISRSVEMSEGLTRPGQVVGTIAYLAPECFDTAAPTRVSPAADVFAWGVLVGYAATGRTPFAADSPLATVGRILTQPPDLDGLTGRLRDLVSAALSKDPATRPAARDLLDALLRGERGEPVRGVAPELRAAALAARGSGSGRRRLWRAAVAAAVCAVLAAAGTAVAHFHEVAGAQAAVAARQSRDRTVQDLLNRSAQVSSTDPGLALRLAVSAQSLGPSPRGRGALNALLAAGYAGEVGSGRPLHTVEFRPDGAAVVLGGRDGELDIWAVDGDRFTRAGSLPVADEVTEDAAFTPDGKTLATIGRQARLWDVSDPATPRLLYARAVETLDGDLTVEFTRDGRRLVVQDEKRTAVWDVRDRRHPEAIWSTTPIEDEQTGATALSRDDKIMAGVERHGSLSIWTMTSRTRPRKVATVRGIGQVADIAFSPGADVMAVARVREGIRLYDVSHPTRPRRIADLAEPAEFVSTITFDPTGTRLAIGGSGGAVSLWDVRTPEYAVLVRTLRGVGGAVRDADFSPDGSRVLTVGDGVAHTAMLWRLNPFQAQRRAVLTGRGTYDYSPEVALSPDDDVAVVRSDGKLSSWNLRDVSRPRPIGKPVSLPDDSGVSPLRLRSDLRTVLAGGSLFDITGGRARRLIPAKDGELRWVLDLDSRRDLAAVFDNRSFRTGARAKVLICRVVAGRQPVVLASIPATHVNAAVFVPAAKSIVIADGGNADSAAVTIWDLTEPAKPRVVRTLRSDTEIRNLSTGGRTAFDGSDGIKIWNNRTGDDESVRIAHRPFFDAVVGLSFSAGEEMMAVATAGGTELWSVLDGAEPVLMSVIPGSETSGIAFSARRPLLATADDDKGVVVWDVGSMLATARDPLPAACRRSGGLSESEWRRYVSEVPFRRACR